MTKSKLEQMREVEGKHGPLCCFASAKFALCKLIGLFAASDHLNTFLSSPEGRTLSSRMGGEHMHVAAWGDKTGHEERKRLAFNQKVVPVAKKWGHGPAVAQLRSAPLAFVHVWHDPVGANQLLHDGVPLMVCIKTPWTKHLVVMVMDGNKTIWLVDPWNESTYASVVSLGAGAFFSKATAATINAGEATIPAAPMFHAYFVQRGAPLKSAVGL
jgi:hypothetical protein